MKSIKTNRRKPALLAAAVALLIATGLIVYVAAFNGSIFGWPQRDEEATEKDINYDPPTKEQKKAGQEAKQQAIENAETTAREEEKRELHPVITAANQNPPNLQVRLLIEGLVSNEGTCDLTLTKDDRVVTKSAGIQALASASTCKGFDIPLTELSPGSWNLIVLVGSGSKSGKVQKTVEIQ